MEYKITWVKFKGHLKTVVSHKWYVFVECKRMGLFWNGVFHDMSKFSPSEFIPSVKYWSGTKSPIDTEKEVTGKSMAWLHHKGMNKTHFEYWIDFVKGESIPREMPVEYVIEMVADWIGASKAYGKNSHTFESPLNRFIKLKHEMILHKETSKMFEDFLSVYSMGDEKYFYKYVKTKLKESKHV